MKYNIEIIISCYNEEKSIGILYKRIIDSIKLSKKIKKYKLIYIEDNSTDKTKKNIQRLIKKDKNIKLISLDKRIGKANGLQLGFENIEKNSDLVFMMDADLQDDPKEFDRFIKKIEEGYDIVSGYKKNRLDNIEKKIASKIYNKIVNFLFGMNLHDHNCGFKCFKYEVIKKIHIYDHLHRFIAVICKYNGFSVGEIEVEHHKRKYGKSKYGFSRYLIGIKDIIRMKYILSVKKIKLNVLINIAIFMIGILLYKYVLIPLIIYLIIYLWLVYNYHKYYRINN